METDRYAIRRTIPRSFQPCLPMWEVKCSAGRDYHVDRNLKGKPHLYFIASPDGMVKVGVTQNLFGRFRDIQKSTTACLQLVGSVSFKKMKEAEFVERLMHTMFEDYRLGKSEWFHFSDLIANTMRQHAVELPIREALAG